MLKKFFLEKTILYLIVVKYNSAELLNDYFFFKKIFKKIFLKKIIIIKFGIDPTSQIIHLGHIVLINKINQLKKINFKIIIIIGNFTTFISDPTFNYNSRLCNNKKKISLNIIYFLYQFSFLLNFKNIFIYYNFEWLNLFNLIDLINLLYLINLNKILHREDFKKRFDKNYLIFIPELIYPFLQSYDSVFIKSDIEIGGVDQKLNFLITRDIQKKIYNNNQIILLISLLVGLDGYLKMSKSKFNFLSFNKKIIFFLKKFFFIKNKFFFYYYNNIMFFKKKYIINNTFFYKKKIFLKFINSFFNKDILDYFIKNINIIFFFKINIFYLFIYKILKIIFLIISYNKTIFFIKNNFIFINEILIKNFNFFFLKGKYFIKINKKKYIIFFC